MRYPESQLNAFRLLVLLYPSTDHLVSLLEWWSSPVHVHQDADTRIHQVICLWILQYLQCDTPLPHQCHELFSSGVMLYMDQFNQPVVRWWGLRTAEELAIPIFPASETRLNFELDALEPASCLVQTVLSNQYPVTSVAFTPLSWDPCTVCQLLAQDTAGKPQLDDSGREKVSADVDMEHVSSKIEAEPRSTKIEQMGNGAHSTDRIQTKRTTLVSIRSLPDSDDEDDLVPFGTVETASEPIHAHEAGPSSVPPPRFLRQCIQYLRKRPKQQNTTHKKDDDDFVCYIESGLQNTPSVIRSQFPSLTKQANPVLGLQDLDECAPSLCNALLYLRNEYEIDDFETMKFQSFVALLVGSPEIVGEKVVEGFWGDKNLTIVERMSLLDVMVESARELCGRPSNVAEPGLTAKDIAYRIYQQTLSVHCKTNNDPAGANSHLKSSRTRYFHPISSQIEKHRPSPFVNRLSACFDQWFYPLVHGISTSDLPWLLDIEPRPHFNFPADCHWKIIGTKSSVIGLLQSKTHLEDWMIPPLDGLKLVTPMKTVSAMSLKLLTHWMTSLASLLSLAGPSLHTSRKRHEDAISILSQLFQYVDTHILIFFVPLFDYFVDK
jgi:hypothetical protein